MLRGSMQDQQFKCVDCGEMSPPTEEGETITKQHGWRITRRTTADGKVLLEPRCAHCYATFRAATQTPPTPGKTDK
jgi:hypothetical protein